MTNAKHIAVLDVGSEKLTVYIGNKGINNTFNLKGSAEVDYAGFSNGEWLDEEGLTEAVRRAINAASASANLSVKKLFIGVPGEFTTVCCKEVGYSLSKSRKIKDKDIDALFEMGDTFDDNPKYTTINCSAIYYLLDDNRRIIEPRGLTSSKLKALVSYILCERYFTESMNKVMDELKMSEVEYISSVWAESTLLFEEEQRDRSVLLLDVGHITSSLMLVRGDGLLHLSSFSCGGGNIAADLNMVLDIPYSHAEMIKHKLNLSLSADDDDVYTLYTRGGESSYSMKDVNEVVVGRIEYIGEMTLKCIARCEYECPDYMPLYLTGGGLSYIRGAKEILSRIIGRPLEIIAPPAPQTNFPNLSTTYGLLDVASKSQKNENIFKKIFANI